MEEAELKSNLEIEKVLKSVEEIWKNPELGFEEHKAHKISREQKREISSSNTHCTLSDLQKAMITMPNICVICEYNAYQR